MKLKSSTIIDVDPRFRRLPLLHAGEVLREEFLLPLKLSPYALAKALGVPRTRVRAIGQRGNGADGGHRIAVVSLLGTTAEIWVESANRAHSWRPGETVTRLEACQDHARDRRAPRHEGARASEPGACLNLPGTGEFSPFSARPARSEGPFGIRTH